MLSVLVVSLCKPVIHKLKILGGGNLNIINQWGNHKKGGGGQTLKFQWGDKRGAWNMISDSNDFSGRKNLGGNYDLFSVTVHHNF